MPQAGQKKAKERQPRQGLRTLAFTVSGADLRVSLDPEVVVTVVLLGVVAALEQHHADPAVRCLAEGRLQ